MYPQYDRYGVGEKYATEGFLHKHYFSLLADASNCSVSYICVVGDGID